MMQEGCRTDGSGRLSNEGWLSGEKYRRRAKMATNWSGKEEKVITRWELVSRFDPPKMQVALAAGLQWPGSGGSFCWFSS